MARSLDYSKWDRIADELDREDRSSNFSSASQNKSLNKTDRDGLSELHRAVIACDLKAVDECIGQGADVNAKVAEPHTHAGYAPLHLAVEGRLQNPNACLIIQKLLAQPSIKIDLSEQLGRTPFHVAALIGAVDCADLLREAGANIDALDEQRHTPLDLAANSERVDMVEYLLKHLDSPKYRAALKSLNADGSGDTACHHAMKVQCLRLFNYNFPLGTTQFEIAYLMARAGLDMQRRNSDFDSAFDIMPEPLAQFLEVVSRPAVRSTLQRPGSERLTRLLDSLLSTAPAVAQWGFDSETFQLLTKTAQNLVTFQHKQDEQQARQGGCPVMHKGDSAAALRKFVRKALDGSQQVVDTGSSTPLDASQAKKCPFLSGKLGPQADGAGVCIPPQHAAVAVSGEKQSQASAATELKAENSNTIKVDPLVVELRKLNSAALVELAPSTKTSFTRAEVAELLSQQRSELEKNFSRTLRERTKIPNRAERGQDFTYTDASTGSGKGITDCPLLPSWGGENPSVYLCCAVAILIVLLARIVYLYVL